MRSIATHGMRTCHVIGSVSRVDDNLTTSGMRACHVIGTNCATSSVSLADDNSIDDGEKANLSLCGMESLTSRRGSLAEDLESIPLTSKE